MEIIGKYIGCEAIGTATAGEAASARFIYIYIVMSHIFQFKSNQKSIATYLYSSTIIPDNYTIRKQTATNVCVRAFPLLSK